MLSLQCERPRVRERMYMRACTHVRAVDGSNPLAPAGEVQGRPHSSRVRAYTLILRSALALGRSTESDVDGEGYRAMSTGKDTGRLLLPVPVRAKAVTVFGSMHA